MCIQAIDHTIDRSAGEVRLLPVVHCCGALSRPGRPRGLRDLPAAARRCGPLASHHIGAALSLAAERAERGPHGHRLIRVEGGRPVHGCVDGTRHYSYTHAPTQKTPLPACSVEVGDGARRGGDPGPCAEGQRWSRAEGRSEGPGRVASAAARVLHVLSSRVPRPPPQPLASRRASHGLIAHGARRGFT